MTTPSGSCKCPWVVPMEFDAQTTAYRVIEPTCESHDERSAKMVSLWPSIFNPDGSMK